jgi:hypothetical protein
LATTILIASICSDASTSNWLENTNKECSWEVQIARKKLISGRAIAIDGGEKYLSSIERLHDGSLFNFIGGRSFLF